MRLADILKTDNIITVSPEDSLSFALGKLSSSHDAAFVFDTNKKLVGVINPYYSLIKYSYPGNAKAGHCMTMPPKLHLTTKLTDAARLLVESKIHYLPVFDEKEQFVGIVSARRILENMTNLNELAVPIATILKNKRAMITIDADEKISHAIQLYKKSRVSKLVVVDKDKKLKGVLAYFDLISYLAAPKHRESEGDRKGAKIPVLNDTVRKFMKPYVLTLTENDTAVKAIKLILEKKIGSVVITKDNNIPVNIITSKDILEILYHTTSVVNFEVITKNVSDVSKKVIETFSDRFTNFLAKKKDVEKATLIVKEERGGSLFQVLLSVFPKPGNGKRKVIETEGYNLGQILAEVKEKAKR